MTRASRIDFGPYEPSYPELFRLLRKAGWYPERYVDFPDVTEEGGALLALDDYPAAFLHSFYGLNVGVDWAHGRREVSIGFGKPWDAMHFDKYGWGIANYAESSGAGVLPYPVLSSDDFVGFVTMEGHAVAVDHMYQWCMRADDPFQLMEWILFRTKKPGLEVGPLDEWHVPFDFVHLIWLRPPEYFLPRYRVHALTEGAHTQYVLEYIHNPKLYGVHVTSIQESGADLFVAYRRNNLVMPPSTAGKLIVCKVLDEFFEGTYRPRIERIHLKDEKTGNEATLTWP